MMKHLILFLSLSVILGCSKTEPDPESAGSNNGGNSNSGGGNSGGDTFLDSDGDGVDDETELSDATDPDDPCSFILASQQYSFASEDWRNLDCDGDGVINGTEVDPDGNNQNEENGTDPLDLCSFVLADQTTGPSQEWDDADCDEDCQSNGREVFFGTDPLDPIDKYDLSEKISDVYDNGTNYKINSDEQQLIIIFYDPFYYRSFSYDDGILTGAEYGDIDQGIIYSLNFNYANEQIETINYDFFDITVEYDANTITTNHIYAPPGLFATKVTLDPGSQRIVGTEEFKVTEDEDIYQFLVSAFVYDSEMENLIQKNVEEFSYDASAGTYTPSGAASYDYIYYENVLNPFYDSYSKLELQHRLSRVTLQYQEFSLLSAYVPIDAIFSKNILRESNFLNSQIIYVPDECAESNSYPFKIDKIYPSGDVLEMNFFYSW